MKILKKNWWTPGRPSTSLFRSLKGQRIGKIALTIFGPLACLAAVLGLLSCRSAVLGPLACLATALGPLIYLIFTWTVTIVINRTVLFLNSSNGSLSFSFTIPNRLRVISICSIDMPVNTIICRQRTNCEFSKQMLRIFNAP